VKVDSSFTFVPTLRPRVKGDVPVRPTKIYRLHDGFFAASRRAIRAKKETPTTSVEAKFASETATQQGTKIRPPWIGRASSAPPLAVAESDAQHKNAAKFPDCFFR
jgi:hypothetical protein